MKKSRLLSCFFILLVWLGICFARPPLGTIKGIEKNVKTEHLRMTPLIGAIWWHSPILRNLFEYGDETGLPKLVRALFHVVQGQFTVTQNDSYPARHFSPALVAKIVLRIDKEIETLRNFREAKAQKVDNAVVQASLKSSLRKIILQDKTFARESWRVEGIFKEIEKELADVKKEEKTSETENRIRFLRKKLSVDNAEKLVGENLDNLLDGICESFFVSGYFDNKPNLFKDGLHNVFMAFLYQKSDSKKEFQEYFSEFDDSYFSSGGKAAIAAESWLNERFEKKDVASVENHYLNDNLSKKSPDDAKKVIDLLGDVSFEAYVYAQIMNKYFLASFPPSTEYRSIFYKSLPFPDCMETTLRNLCNCIVFDSNSFVFKTDLYEEWDPIDKIKEFYRKYSDPTGVGLPEIHFAWADCVENIELIAYNRFSKFSMRTADHLKIEGFVPVKGLQEQVKAVKELGEWALQNYKVKIADVIVSGQTFVAITVGERTYYLFEPLEDVFAYEVQPSMRNLLMIVQHFFRPKNKKKEPIIKELSLKRTLVDPFFNDSYGERLLKAVRLDGEEIGSWRIDDYTGHNVGFVTTREAGSLHVALNYGHGQADTKAKKVLNLLDISNDLYSYLLKSSRKTSMVRNVLSAHGLQLLLLNPPFFEEVVKRGLYQIQSEEKWFKRWLYFLPLVTLLDKKTALIELLKSDNLSKLANDRQRDDVTSFWLNILRRIRFVDGQTQETVLSSLDSSLMFQQLMGGNGYEETRLREIERSFSGQGVYPESFLYTFLAFIRNRLCKDRMRLKQFSFGSVKKALNIVGKSRNDAFNEIIVDICQKFFAAKDKEVIKLAYELIMFYMDKLDTTVFADRVVKIARKLFDENCVQSIQEKIESVKEGKVLRGLLKKREKEIKKEGSARDKEVQKKIKLLKKKLNRFFSKWEKKDLKLQEILTGGYDKKRRNKLMRERKDELCQGNNECATIREELQRLEEEKKERARRVREELKNDPIQQKIVALKKETVKLSFDSFKKVIDGLKKIFNAETIGKTEGAKEKVFLFEKAARLGLVDNRFVRDLVKDDKAFMLYEPYYLGDFINSACLAGWFAPGGPFTIEYGWSLIIRAIETEGFHIYRFEDVLRHVLPRYTQEMKSINRKVADSILSLLEGSENKTVTMTISALLSNKVFAVDQLIEIGMALLNKTWSKYSYVDYPRFGFKLFVDILRENKETDRKLKEFIFDKIIEDNLGGERGGNFSWEVADLLNLILLQDKSFVKKVLNFTKIEKAIKKQFVDDAKEARSRARNGAINYLIEKREFSLSDLIEFLDQAKNQEDISSGIQWAKLFVEGSLLKDKEEPKKLYRAVARFSEEDSISILDKTYLAIIVEKLQGD